MVQAKAAAASKWCKTANLHAESALLPDDQITGAATLDGLLARFSQ
jgi:type III restriction enzyme